MRIGKFQYKPGYSGGGCSGGRLSVVVVTEVEVDTDQGRVVLYHAYHAAGWPRCCRYFRSKPDQGQRETWVKWKRTSVVCNIQTQPDRLFSINQTIVRLTRIVNW